VQPAAYYFKNSCSLPLLCYVLLYIRTLSVYRDHHIMTCIFLKKDRRVVVNPCNTFLKPPIFLKMKTIQYENMTFFSLLLLTSLLNSVQSFLTGSAVLRKVSKCEFLVLRVSENDGFNDDLKSMNPTERSTVPSRKDLLKVFFSGVCFTIFFIHLYIFYMVTYWFEYWYVGNRDRSERDLSFKWSLSH